MQMFAIPFEETAAHPGAQRHRDPSVGESGAPRIQHADADHGPDRLRQSRLVDAFLAAARRGDFSALLELLDPDAVLRCDAAAVALGGPKQAHGAEAVAALMIQACGVQPALIDGAPAAAWLPRGQLRVALLFTFSADRIAAIPAVAEPERLATLDLVIVGDAWT